MYFCLALVVSGSILTVILGHEIGPSVWVVWSLIGVFNVMVFMSELRNLYGQILNRYSKA